MKRSRKKLSERKKISEEKGSALEENCEALNVGRVNFHIPPAIQGCLGLFPYPQLTGALLTVEKTRLVRELGSKAVIPINICCRERWQQS